MKLLKLSCLMLLMSIALPGMAQVKTLKVNDFNDPNGAYTIAMIKLALEHMDNKYSLAVSNEDFTQARSNELVKNGGLDLIWTTTGKETEEELEPVRIPLFKGLLGCRIFIINKNCHCFFQTFFCYSNYCI